MRRRHRTTLALALGTALVTGALAVSTGASAAPEPTTTATVEVADAYSWQNVRIDGGGFVPGIVFNRAEPDLAYARTDIGGAYRWQEASRTWTPLLDQVGWDDWGHTGVASLATDAVDPDRVYAAVGTYTIDWDPGNGAVLRSHDRGATWQKTDLPFKLGGNMPGRGMGERLAIDPHDNRVLYLGAPSGHGLWRSTNSGVTWSEVTAFPNAGTYAPDPDDSSGYQADRLGVTWVTFDESTGTAGSPTGTIYVGVADLADSVYRSTDAGATWQRLAGQPTGLLPHRGELDTVNGHLYLAYSDTGGPYDGSTGAVWRYTTATGTWQDITPVEDPYYGFSGLSIDRQNPDTVMVTGYSSWWPDTQIFRTTDAGESWTSAWEFTSYPNRDNRYTIDVSSVPWLTWGANPSPPEETPKLGWMTEALAIDPFDSDRMMYGTGATIFGTENLGEWDADRTFTITPMVRGLEETAVLDLISPPSGAPLISGLGDIGGFRHTDLDTVPMMFTQPTFTSTTSLDYAEGNPGVVVRSGDTDAGAHIAFSTDNGAHWFAGQEPSGVTGGGTVAASADGSRFVWSPQGAGVHTAAGFGTSWTAATGIPSGAIVESDRVDPATFYGFHGGTFYVSTDGGVSFTATASGLPAEGNVRFKAAPGHEGDIWLAGGEAGGTYGLWRSTDGGAGFARLTTVDEADAIGFGRAADGAGYHTLFTSAKIDGVRGIFRSTDEGASWVRINDDAHQWGWTGSTITGDPRVFGRVYVATNGRGVVYGTTTEAGGPIDPTDPTGPVDPTDPTDPTDPVDPTDPGDAECAVTYQVTGEWQGGFQSEVTVANTGPSAWNGWSLRWTFPDGQRISQAWNAGAVHSGDLVTVTDAGWNASVPPGGSVSFGFTATAPGGNTAPSAFTLGSGAACTTAAH